MNCPWQASLATIVKVAFEWPLRQVVIIVLEVEEEVVALDAMEEQAVREVDVCLEEAIST
jgi:hypothetical protein